MANDHSFPLLRLPLLAVIKGVHLMNVREQFKLSKVSKRSLFIVRSSVKKQCYQLELELRQGFPVTINNLTAMNEYKFNLQPINGLDYPDVDSIKKFIVQVAAIFSNLSIYLDGYLAPHPRYLMELVPFSKDLNLTLALIDVSSDTPDNELCRFIFKECSDFKKVIMFCKTSPGFYITPEKIEEFHGVQFAIKEPWFTMKHVLQSFMNCKKLYLCLPFCTIELNEFLHKWIQGSGVLILQCQTCGDIPMDEILQGITAVSEPEVLISFSGYEFSPYHDCFIIEQSNGTKAVVCVSEGKYFHLSTVFELENGEKYGDYKEEDYFRTELDDESSDK